MDCVVERRVPTVEEFNFLRTAASWPVLSENLTRTGLDNTLFGVCLFVSGKIIAMGRVVGDGAIYFHVSDVIVHPDFQRRGYGKIIMKELLEYIERAGGKNTNVGLMSSKGRERFYEEFGFTQRPAENFGAGMIRVL